jgi:LysM repeat protein
MRRLLWTAALSLCIAGTTLAQSACPTVIQDALSAIANNCSDLSRNTACYGFDQVNADFSTEHPADYFTQETDQAGLTDLTTIQTSPLDEENEEFGAAVMNLQANVPNSIPGQGVIFLLLGETNVQNAVAAADASEPIAAVAVQTANDATVYRLPSSTAATLTDVAAGETLNADGTNTNAEWVRVIVDEEVGWIAATDLEASDALASLPDVGSTTRTPMQAFYFTTGIGQSECNQAESTIAVQSPEGIEVDLSVNGVDIRVGSLVTFQGDSMTVHRGKVETATGDVVDANETLTFPGRDEEGNFTGDGSVRPISDEEYERGQTIQDTLNDIAEANDWETREITERSEEAVATEEATSEPDANPTARPTTDTSTANPNRYIVQRGDTLFRIAFRLNTSMQEIIDANALTSPYTLFVGQELVIPNPGSGFIGLPGTGPTTPPTTQPPSDTVVEQGATIVGPNNSGGYVGGAVAVPAGGTVRDVFTLYGFGYTSQLGLAGTYDCSRVVLYRVEGDARATKQAFTCSQGAITTTSVGTGDYLIIDFATAADAAAAPQSFSLLTGQ